MNCNWQQIWPMTAAFIHNAHCRHVQYLWYCISALQLVIVTATNYETLALHLFPPNSIKSLIHHSIWKFAGFSIKLVFKVNDRKQAVCAIGESGTQQWFINLGTNKWCFNWLTAFIVFKYVWQFSWLKSWKDALIRWTKNPNKPGQIQKRHL